MDRFGGFVLRPIDHPYGLNGFIRNRGRRGKGIFKCGIGKATGSRQQGIGKEATEPSSHEATKGRQEGKGNRQ
jgi:hypothetical protein